MHLEDQKKIQDRFDEWCALSEPGGEKFFQGYQVSRVGPRLEIEIDLRRRGFDFQFWGIVVLLSTLIVSLVIPFERLWLAALFLWGTYFLVGLRELWRRPRRQGRIVVDPTTLTLEQSGKEPTQFDLRTLEEIRIERRKDMGETRRLLFGFSHEPDIHFSVDPMIQVDADFQFLKTLIETHLALSNRPLKNFLETEDAA